LRGAGHVRNAGPALAENCRRPIDLPAGHCQAEKHCDPASASAAATDQGRPRGRSPDV